MKKIFLISIAAVFMITLGSGLALATTQTYADNTLVQASGSGSGYTGGAWYDIIGDQHYDIIQTSVTWSGSDVTLAISTKNNGTPEGSDHIADVAIDLDRDGVFESGIVLKAHDSLTAGTVYTLSTATANTDLWKITDNYPGGVYSTNYDRNNSTTIHDPAKIPVYLKNITYDSTFAGSVSWTQPSDYLVTITLTGINTSGDWDHFDFLWGSETCGNDTQFDHANVPLPPSMLLLGTGLLGLVGLRARKIKDGPAMG
jgi:hypothetical protein